MEEEWVNWSGSVSFRPGEMQMPENEEEVRRLVLKAIKHKKTLKVFGAGHSSTPLVVTPHILISQDKLSGLIDYDKEKCQATLLPGTNIAEAGKELIKLRLSMYNTGDVDFQLISGAFGTGTHGSGVNLQNLPAMMVGCRLVNGKGEVQEFDMENQPSMMQAARVALGSLGVFTSLTLQLVPARKYVRKEFCTHIDTCLEHLDELIHGNQMMDFYWYPRNDEAKIRICNPEAEGMQDIPYAEKVKENKGWLHEILPQFRELKFEEMEYALPAEAGPGCFREIRKRVKEKHRHYVGWRVLYRTVAADNAYLSPFYKRNSVTIAVLQNHELEYKSYFNDIEPVFRDHEGRPHWGKKHSLAAKELKPLYPAWDEFMKIRRKMDPEGIFLNEYLKKLFGL